VLLLHIEGTETEQFVTPEVAIVASWKMRLAAGELASR
jgi:hypothetical protein